MPTQYVSCQYRVGDLRTYTYANDGEPVVEGDQVEIATKKGGKQVVRVVAISSVPPKFETKAILGKYVEPPVD